MKTKLLPAVGEEPVMLHGADYNPDQWLAYPEVLEEDIRLMKLARCNVMPGTMPTTTASRPPASP